MTRPLIGITPEHSIYRPDPPNRSFYIGYSLNFLKDQYYQAIHRCGGLPVVIPLFDDPDTCADLVSRLDGLLLSGGADFSPRLYGEAPSYPYPEGEIDSLRDGCEVACLRAALADGIPIMGICRGHQLSCVVQGGDIWQDFRHRFEAGQPTLDHRRLPLMPPENKYHHVTLTADSPWRDALPERFEVNTSHHQIVRVLPPSARVLAIADDGVIEAIAYPHPSFFETVQWHPEGQLLSPDGDKSGMADWLFRRFIAAAQANRRS